VPGKQAHQKQLQQALQLSSIQVPPLVLHWLSIMGCNSFPWCSLDFLLGYSKYASLGIGKILGHFSWYLPSFVVGRSPYDTCFLAPTQFLTHFLILLWFTPPSLSWPPTNIASWYPNKQPELNALSWKWNTTDFNSNNCQPDWIECLDTLDVYAKVFPKSIN
jgi:hypothetical protein